MKLYRILIVFLILMLFNFPIPPSSHNLLLAKKGSDNTLNLNHFQLSVSNGLVTLNAQKADLRRILEEIAEKPQIIIEIDPSLE